MYKGVLANELFYCSFHYFYYFLKWQIRARLFVIELIIHKKNYPNNSIERSPTIVYLPDYMISKSNKRKRKEVGAQSCMCVQTKCICMIQSEAGPHLVKARLVSLWYGVYTPMEINIEPRRHLTLALVERARRTHIQTCIHKNIQTPAHERTHIRASKKSHSAIVSCLVQSR